jgi:hypothetical protein
MQVAMLSGWPREPSFTAAGITVTFGEDARTFVVVNSGDLEVENSLRLGRGATLALDPGERVEARCLTDCRFSVFTFAEPADSLP